MYIVICAQSWNKHITYLLKLSIDHLQRLILYIREQILQFFVSVYTELSVKHWELSPPLHTHTLLEKLRRISLYLTDDAIAQFYATYKFLEGNGRKFSNTCRAKH